MTNERRSGPIKLLLVDDEAPARLRLRDLLGDLAPEITTEVISEAGDGGTALLQLEQHSVDVALIDIRMPGMDGIELARHIAALPDAPAIIFVTAYDQYAVKAFDLSAVDYLLKPVRAERLAEALRKARRHADDGARFRESAHAMPNGARKHLSCMERGRILLVPVSQILYLRAEQKYVTARTVERDYLLEEALIQLEQEFSDRFLRIHRSCLVARTALAGVERAPESQETDAHWQVILKGINDRLPVSRRQWSQVRSLLKLGGP